MPIARHAVNSAEQASRILMIYHAATEQEKREGLTWYWDANRFALNLAKRHGVTHRQTCGIIAALSPQITWENNLKLAEQFLRTKGRTASLQSKANIRKARRILKGENPAEVLRGSSPHRGQKTRNFFHCILEPNASAPVCLDRHAWALVNGERWSTEKQRQTLERVGVYAATAETFRQVAQTLELIPSQLQAITWVAWRSIKLDDVRALTVGV